MNLLDVVLRLTQLEYRFRLQPEKKAEPELDEKNIIL